MAYVIAQSLKKLTFNYCKFVIICKAFNCKDVFKSSISTSAKHDPQGQILTRGMGSVRSGRGDSVDVVFNHVALQHLVT